MLECRYNLEDILISDNENEILKELGKYKLYIYYSPDNSYELINRNVYKVGTDEDLISLLKYYFSHKNLFTK